MNMYFDTPRDFIGGVYDELLYGDQPLGWDIIGRRRPSRGRPRHVPRLRRPLVQARADGRRARRQARRRPRSRRCERLLGDLEAARDRRAGAGRASTPTRPARDASITSSPTRRTSASACGATRSTIRTATRCSCSRPCSAAACRRGSSPRCASGAGSPTTSSRTNQSYTDAGSLYSQAGVDINRVDEAVETIAREFQQDRRRSRSRRGAREGARASPRGASCSSSRTRRG